MHDLDRYASSFYLATQTRGRPFDLDAMFPAGSDRFSDHPALVRHLVTLLAGLPLNYRGLVGDTEAWLVITGAATQLLEVLADGVGGAVVLEVLARLCPQLVTPLTDPLMARRLLGILTAVVQATTGSFPDAVHALNECLVELFINKGDLPPPTVAAGITALVAVRLRDDMAYTDRLHLLDALSGSIGSVCTDHRPDMHVVLMAALTGVRQVVRERLFHEAAASQAAETNPLSRQEQPQVDWGTNWSTQREALQVGLRILMSKICGVVERVHAVLALGDRRTSTLAIVTLMHIQEVMRSSAVSTSCRDMYLGTVRSCLDSFLESVYTNSLCHAFDAGMQQAQAPFLPGVNRQISPQTVEQTRMRREARMLQGLEPDEETAEDSGMGFETQDDVTWHVAMLSQYLAGSLRDLARLYETDEHGAARVAGLTARATSFVWTFLGLGSHDDLVAASLRTAGTITGQREGCRLVTQVRVLELVAILFNRPDVRADSSCTAAATQWYIHSVKALKGVCTFVDTNGRLPSSPGMETDGTPISSTYYYAPLMRVLITLGTVIDQVPAYTLLGTHGSITRRAQRGEVEHTLALDRALLDLSDSCDATGIYTWLLFVTHCLPPGTIDIEARFTDSGLRDALTSEDFWLNAALMCENAERAMQELLSLFEHQVPGFDASYRDSIAAAWEASTRFSNEQDEDEDEVGQQGQQAAGASMDQAAGHFDQAAAHGQDMTGDAGGMEI